GSAGAPWSPTRPHTDIRLIHYRAHDGVVRRAWLMLPTDYNGEPLPLVISPHGRGTSARANSRLWGDLPGLGGFAVVNPAGEGRVLGEYSWGDPGQIDDLARMPAIVRAHGVNIDRRRIYAFGGAVGGPEAPLPGAPPPGGRGGVGRGDRQGAALLGLGRPARRPRLAATRTPRGRRHAADGSCCLRHSKPGQLRPPDRALRDPAAALLEQPRPRHLGPGRRDRRARTRDPRLEPGGAGRGVPRQLAPHRRDALDETASGRARPLRAAHAGSSDPDLTSAASRSATRSSTDSIPTERRTRLRGAANGASALEACVMRAGCSIRLSTAPSDSASWKSVV